MLSLSQTILNPKLFPLDLAVAGISYAIITNYNNRFWEIRNKFVECNATSYKDPAIAKQMSICEKNMLDLAEFAKSNNFPLLKVPCTPSECQTYWIEANTLETSPLKRWAEIGETVTEIAKWHTFAIVSNYFGN